MYEWMNFNINGIDEFLKDVENVTQASKIKILINESLFYHLAEYIYSYIESEINYEEIRIPETRISVSEEDSKDRKRHHFYFGFKSNLDKEKIEVDYLGHQAFEHEYDNLAHVYYLGFNTLQIELDAVSRSGFKINVEELKSDLVQLSKKMDNGETERCIRLLQEPYSKDGKRYAFVFEIRKSENGWTEISYRKSVKRR